MRNPVDYAISHARLTLATLIFLFIVVFASMLTLWLRRREIQF